jgi:hypothetical protein
MRSGGARLAAGCLALGVLVTGCDGPATDSTTTLSALSVVKVLSVPPVGGIEIGSARDHGSDSSITGRDPALETVYALPGTVADAAAFYLRTYPQYRLGEEPVPPTAGGKELIGQDGWAGVIVDISSGKPDLQPDFAIRLAPVRAADATYVVIDVTGHPPSMNIAPG